MVFMKFCAILIVGCVLIAISPDATGERFAVHEWGTFTSLQDEEGRAIAGINTDDEPVPKFVHDIAPLLLIPPGEFRSALVKGVTRCHPGVTMRLETPVVYFHAPDGLPADLSVRATFRGGWLTQYYPTAAVSAPGINFANRSFGELTQDTVGSLEWRNLVAGNSSRFPETSDAVWLAPRAVDSQPIATGGETEQFLFYRGVAHLDAPIRVVRCGDTLRVERSTDDVIDRLWLVDVRPDGATAYRRIEADRTGGAIATIPAEFTDAEYSDPASLRDSLFRELVAEGLRADEADAMLETWKISYFESPGLRLFFVVPRSWTDRVLPLEISGAPEIVRVMIGRIEIVTPHQRELLRILATQSSTLTQDASYVSLGRFRNALILDEHRRSPSPTLEKFIRLHDVQAHTVP